MGYSRSFVRKPWFIISDHFINNISLLSKHLAGSKAEILNNPEEYFYQQPYEPILVSEQEERWKEKGVNFLGNPYQLNYGKRWVVKGMVGIFCKAIELELGISGKETKRARVIQDEIYAKLNEKNELETKAADLEITHDQVLMLIDYACDLIADKSTDDFYCMQGIRVAFLERHPQAAFLSDEERKYGFAKEQHSQIWKNKNLAKIQTGRWLCFQRTEGCKNDEASFGISISPIELLESSGGKVTAYMQTKYYSSLEVEQTFEYIGLVTIDPPSKNLIIELKRVAHEDSPGTLAYFVMQQSGKDQKLMMGYYLYYSMLSGQFIAKVVVWHRLDDSKINFSIPSRSSEEVKELFAQYVSDLDPITDPEMFSQIPLSIRRLLASRAKNRITIPRNDIKKLTGNNDSLDKWYKGHLHHSDDQVLTACAGCYKVYYYFSDTEITDSLKSTSILRTTRADELILDYDINTGEYKATFIHERNKSILYKGIYRREGETVQVCVDSSWHEKYSVNTSMIFLSFSIPKIGRHVFGTDFAKYQTFKGLISGLNDNELTPVSFLILMEKTDRTLQKHSFDRDDVDNPISKKLISFFRKNATQLKIKVPPYEEPATVAELEEIIHLANMMINFSMDDNFIRIFENRGDAPQMVYKSDRTYNTRVEGILDMEERIRSLCEKLSD